MTMNGSMGWNNQMPPATFQTGAHDNSLWAQVMAPEAVQAQMQTLGTDPPGQRRCASSTAYSGRAQGESQGVNQLDQTARLPVPYLGQTGVQPQPLVILSPLKVGDAGGALIPVQPGEDTPAPIRVLPMYTRPRAIIPRYRAISGLISFIVVLGLLCTGAGYYAKATGKLSFLHQLYGDARPRNVQPSPTQQLLIPSTAATYGPGSVVINSATTASRIDMATSQPLIPTNVFKVGETIFLTYSVHPKSPGAVTVKWYTNGAFYLASRPIPVSDSRDGYAELKYPLPVEGMVELYWNNQLAIRLLFVVEP